MKTGFWVTAIGVFFIVLVVRAIPAQWGIWMINSPLQMDGVTGTLWSGKAANVVMPYPGGLYSLGELRWDMHPMSVLMLSPCADISSTLSNQKIKAVACSNISGSLTLKNVEITVPAAAAEIWAPVSVQGEVFIQVSEMKIAGEQVVSMEGGGSWSGARYHNSRQWMSLGTIAFDLGQDNNGGIQAKVFDVEGPMKLDLTALISLSGQYDIRGDIIVKPEAPQEIAQFLMIVAREVSNNHFEFEWVGG